MPLTLTILSAAVPKEKRGLALGAWGGISGLAVAFGPRRRRRGRAGALLAVDLLAERADRHRPGPARALAPAGEPRAGRQARPSGPRARQRRPVRDRLGPDPRQRSGLGEPEIVASLAVGAAARRRVRRLGAADARRRCCRCASSASRAFALANLSSLFMFFGMFGSIFLLSQFFQTVQGYSPLGAGLRILPWTLAPMFISPIAGALSDRIRRKTLIGIGLSLQAIGSRGWASSPTPTVAYSELDRTLRDRRDRDVALLRADGEHRPLGGAAGGGGPGVRRQQRDPRARRRVRRRRSRGGVRARSAATRAVRHSATA